MTAWRNLIIVMAILALFVALWISGWIVQTKSSRYPCFTVEESKAAGRWIKDMPANPELYDCAWVEQQYVIRAMYLFGMFKIRSWDSPTEKCVLVVHSVGNRRLKEWLCYESKWLLLHYNAAAGFLEFDDVTEVDASKLEYRQRPNRAR
jgi:hypothetical protein